MQTEDFSFNGFSIIYIMAEKRNFGDFVAWARYLSKKN